MAENTHHILAALVARVKCKPGWTFRLKDEDGALRLVIRCECLDSATPNEERPFLLDHYFPVPIATYNEKSWRRWIFDRCLAVEVHEMGEWFRDVAERPFAPLHGPGEDPYTLHEFRPVVDELTTQDGSIREPYGE